MTAGRCRHRDVHAGVGVLHDLHIHPIRNGQVVLGQDRLGIGHETGRQGVILPARRKQGRELVLLFSQHTAWWYVVLSLKQALGGLTFFKRIDWAMWISGCHAPFGNPPRHSRFFFTPFRRMSATPPFS